MKILHTSDWHLGSSLYGCKRTVEHRKFLYWLLETIKKEQIDLLLVAGDIFDNTTPSNSSQRLYYWFLKQVISTGCKNVVITAGNHDSPSLLEAPKDILQAMNVHVIGRITDDLDREILTITDSNGDDPLIVCGVPYLRDRDIRQARAGESIDDKSRNIISGIASHYDEIIGRAQTVQNQHSEKVPLVVMGHLFAAGGNSVEGDGVRDLYIGNLAHVPATIFPDSIDYLALGHLHSPQVVGHCQTKRYCGSPLPMSFTETEKQKQVLIVTFDKGVIRDIEPIQVPCFQKLVRLQGDLETVLNLIEELKTSQESIWLEIIYEGKELVGNLQNSLQNAVNGSRLKILRIINKRILQTVQQETSRIPLEDLSVKEVFDKCIASHDIPVQQKPELTKRFEQILGEMDEEETNET